MAQAIVLITGSRRGAKVDPNTLRVQPPRVADDPFPTRPNKALLKTLEQLQEIWEIPFEEVRGQVARIVGERIVELLRELREGSGTTPTSVNKEITLDQLANYFKQNAKSWQKLVEMMEAADTKQATEPNPVSKARLSPVKFVAPAAKVEKPAKLTPLEALLAQMSSSAGSVEAAPAQSAPAEPTKISTEVIQDIIEATEPIQDLKTGFVDLVDLASPQLLIDSGDDIKESTAITVVEVSSSLSQSSATEAEPINLDQLIKPVVDKVKDDQVKIVEVTEEVIVSESKAPAVTVLASATPTTTPAIKILEPINPPAATSKGKAAKAHKN